MNASGMIESLDEHGVKIVKPSESMNVINGPGNSSGGEFISFKQISNLIIISNMS